MQKNIIQIDKEKGIYQITTTDERWYTIEKKNAETGLPEFQFLPSVTWITNYVYKGIEFYKWLANKGWDEAEALKVEAGDKGSKVHTAIENLLNGLAVKMEDKYYNNSKEQEEELKPEEYNAIASFVTWFNEVKPEILLKETTVTSAEYNFAGTIDCVCRINGELYIIDFKTSQYIWPSMEAQLSAYKRAINEERTKNEPIKLAILQLGYKRNKKSYKFTVIEDKFEELFIPALRFWKNATSGQSPKQVELPLELKLDLTPQVEEVKKVKKIKQPKQ